MGDVIAQRRIADEYDAAQERGEVAKSGQQDRARNSIPDGNSIATVSNIGISSKQIHEGREIRDAGPAALDLRAEHFESPVGCSDAAAYIAAVMLWPGEEDRQREWQRLAGVVRARAVLLETGADEMEVRAGDIVDFADGVARLNALLPEINARISQLEQCGQILVDYLDSRGLAGRGVRFPPRVAPLSLGKARQQNAHELEVQGKRPHLASEITMKKLWTEFRPVAHLAGAMVNLQMTQPPVDPGMAQFPCENHLLPFFLTRAELIRRETIRAGLAKADTLLAVPPDVVSLLCDVHELENPLTIESF